VVKNKIAPPFRSAEFDLMHDRGISREGDVIDMAIEDRIIDKSGAWLNYGEMRLGQGRENAKQFLRDNPKLMDEISKKILIARKVVPETMAKGEAKPGGNGKAEESAVAKAEKGKKPVSAER
jgi:recombination protein RecA